MFNQEIKFNKNSTLKSSEKSNKVFIIAEAGVSHFGSIYKAKKLVDLAKKSGADAIKFQAYITSELISNRYKKWFKRYKSKEVDMKFFSILQSYCKKKKILFLLTPHSITGINWVKKLKLKIVKIGSGEINNYDFIEKTAELKVPIIISTGMHTRKDILNLKNFLLKKKLKNIIFLKCITLYPTPLKLINLNSFIKFKEILNPAIVGYSDHSANDLAILSAVTLGARVIEKHISLDFNLKNAQDWKVSHDLKRMTKLVKDIRSLEKTLGNKVLAPTKEELKSKIWATRSIHTSKKIKLGELFTDKNLVLLRPGNGIPPKNLKTIIGSRAKKNYRLHEKI